jgi:putative SbcD/Mre11-related phosphoesterase
MKLKKSHGNKKNPVILLDSRIIDLSLYLEKEKALVISDLHFGIEEALKEQGMLAPRFNYQDIVDRLNKIFLELQQKQKPIEKIIITGDLKHEFGRVSQQEWGEVIDFIRFLQKNCSEVVLIRGNHDNILEPVAQWERIRLHREFFLEKSGILILHGDEIPLSENYQKAKTIIIGHEHPAVALREGAKTEKFKCFLKGKFEGKTIVVLPPFNSYSEGSDLTQNQPLSPFLSEKLGQFEVWAIADQTYYFGKLKRLLQN